MPPAKKTIKKPAKVKVVKKMVIKPIVEVVEITEEMEAPKTNGNEKYFSSIGRRKESIARVRLYTKKSSK